MRLIDGDALVNTLKGLRALANILSGSREMPHIPFDDMVRMIEKSPTIEPVRNGKWLWELADNGWANHICSECGWTKNTDIHVSLGYKFCPNCGCSMEEGEQDG